MLPHQTQSGMSVETRSTQISPEGTAERGFDLRRIGELLREVRERKGLSLSDVSGSLFLAESRLSAIESGLWDALPHPVYVKGYVKSYAGYLDVYKKIEEHLPPVEAFPKENRKAAFAVQKNGAPEPEDRWIHRLWRLPLRAWRCRAPLSSGRQVGSKPLFLS